MTEISVSIEDGEGPEIHWGAFVLALVLAPAIVAVLGSWLVIPVFAVIFGTPTYLAFGGPAFYLAIRHFNAGPIGTAVAGFLANLASAPAVFLYGELGGNGENLAEFIIPFGCIFAPIWGLAFGLVYIGLRRV